MSDSANMEISSTEYATRAKQLMKLALNLRDLGAETEFDFPRIVVIGGQSAGKSSLVEAVTGIRVPRDSGTCTRCPMECNMNETTGDWKCKISLRFVYENDVALAAPRVVDFGSPITDKSEVELALRRAQAAILNQHRPPQSFLERDIDELNYYRTEEAFEEGTQKFSLNTVRIDIYDPDCAPLTFVDLPGLCLSPRTPAILFIMHILPTGLIHNEEGEVVDMVVNLVKTQIKGNSLILVTVPMTDDMKNQQSMKLAREADPMKSRTIGVLTKPDALGRGATGARKTWTEVLEGRSDELRLGYYCVRLADDEERAKDLSRAETQHLASLFFQTTDPWMSIQDRSRFGIPALVKALSGHLTELLDRTLPTMKAQTQKKIDECRKELAKLPSLLIHEPSAEILDLINRFCGELNIAVYGNGNLKTFIQQNRATYRTFKIKIRGTAPDFRPVETNPEVRCGPIRDDEDMDEMDSVHHINAKKHDLYSVRRVIKESIAWELPHNVPFDAKAFLIRECLDNWDSPALACHDAVSTRLHGFLDIKVKEHFKRFPKLQAYVWQLIEEHFKHHRDLSQQAVKISLAMEKNPLFTQNHHYLDSVREKWLSLYRIHRRQHAMCPAVPCVICLPGSPTTRSCSPQPEIEYDDAPTRAARYLPQQPNGREITPLERALSALSELGYSGLTTNDLARLSPPDSFEDELIVMADVRSYFQAAYKRIIDHLPLTIEHSLNQAMANSIQMVLVDSLALGSADAHLRLKELVTEESAISARRDALNSKITKLKAILEQFSKFGV
ncbi:P-loop containing nucleoside triphosphate hydrolase protein [Rickenella mellea]|uniref:P-loop containing nucleoside triphosphate hydrolase protein n=1 Tax=Rickenella mellea TaxID=50990 RepID=A0A4Y7PL79_9AGAM|nr:P-loop containing nucleoside triphosphate hydrolase protein [Rickenella mellea]